MSNDTVSLKLEALDREIANLRDIANGLRNVHLLRARQLDAVANAFTAIRAELGDTRDALEHAATQVVLSAALLTVHGDGRAHFESGADTQRFRAAVAALTAALNRRETPMSTEKVDTYGPVVDPERLAQMIAHRACCGTEHDPQNGKLHGYCVVCGVPWPCEYVGPPPSESPTDSAPAAWWQHCIANGEWYRHDGRTRIAIRLADGADLSCEATRENAMRAALNPNTGNSNGN